MSNLRLKISFEAETTADGHITLTPQNIVMPDFRISAKTTDLTVITSLLRPTLNFYMYTQHGVTVENMLTEVKPASDPARPHIQTLEATIIMK